MRHNKSFNHLSRTTEHRKALLRNLSCSLIMSKRLVTTVAKAKALRSYVEPVITCSKPFFLDKFKKVEDNKTKKPTHPYRKAFRYLGNKLAVKELFSHIGPAVQDRNGGYTRIIKLPSRLGDGAEMCLIELVDYNKLYNPNLKVKVEGSAKKRSRRSKGKRSKSA